MNTKIFYIEEKIIYFFLLLFPFAYIFSIFLTDLIVSLTALIFLFYCIKYQVKKYLINKLSFLIYFFLLYLILRSLFSTNPILSLESSLFFSRHWFFACAIWFILDKKNNFLKYFFIIFILLLCLLLIDSSIQFITNKNILGYPYNGERISSFYKDEFILGGVVSRLILLLLSILFIIYSNNLKLTILFSLIIFVFSFTIILLSGDRIAIVYFIYALILFMVFSEFQLKYKFYLIIFFIILAFGIMIFSEEVFQRLIIISFNQLFVEKIYPEKELTITYFVFYSEFFNDIFYTSMNIFRENYLFGVGTKLFRDMCSQEIYLIGIGCSSHPHNFILQYLVELGIVGTLPIIILIYLLIIRIFNQLKKHYMGESELNRSEFFLGMLILVNLIPLWPTGSFFNNFGSIQHFLPIPFYLFLRYEKKENI